MLNGYNLLLCVVFLLFCPILLGAFFQRFMPKNTGTFAVSYVLGIFFMIALFQLISIPFVLTTQSFYPPFWIWLILIILACVLSVIFNGQWLWEQLCSIKATLQGFSPLLIIALVLIVTQVLLVVLLWHSDADDSFYVGTAVTTLHTGTMFEYNPYYGDVYDALPARYAFSSYTIFCAALAEIVGTHPTILMHTILPVFFISAAYIVYGMIGSELFKGDRNKTALFLIFLSLLNIFGNTSVYTSSSFLLFRIWQGKAILGTVLVPLLFWLMLQIYNKKENITTWLTTGVVVLSACAVSSMGVILAPTFLGCFAIVLAVLQKRIRVFLNILACISPCFVYGILYVLWR